MNKRQRMWAGGVAVVLAGVLLYAMWPTAIEAPSNGAPSAGNNNNKEESFVKAPSSPPKSNPPAVAPVNIALQRGTYEPYSADTLSYARTGIVVLFFNSASCSSCERLDSYINAHLGEIPRDMKILEVNFDTDTATKEKYGIMTPHVLIQIDATGGRVGQWTGSLTIIDILSRLARF